MATVSAVAGQEDEPAQILRVAGREVDLATASGHELGRVRVGIAGGPPVAGDRVLIRRRAGDELVVSEILPRATRLVRGLARAGSRVIAANADLLVVVVAAVSPDPHPRFVDRYLVAGKLGGLACGLVVTKVDLPHDEALVARITEIYSEIGYPIVLGSAREAALVEATRAMIAGRTAVLAGHSGVGKSTLTEALTGVARETAAVSEKAGTGRHTTTDPRLIALPGGGSVIDTAGVRTFHVPPLGTADLADGFPEIAALAGECRFRGCRHDGDAGCAVEGRVSAERLDSYRRLLHGQ